MKVKDFNPDEFIAGKREGFRKQEKALHKLYPLVLAAAPEAEINVRWYGLLQNLTIGLWGKEALKDAPTKLVEQGIELSKIFKPDQGDFDYGYSEGIGQIEFSSLPPNCKIVRKAKTVPAKKAHTETYYEVQCDDPREIDKEVGE